jgi:hypothetical protein
MEAKEMVMSRFLHNGHLSSIASFEFLILDFEIILGGVEGDF